MFSKQDHLMWLTWRHLTNDLNRQYPTYVGDVFLRFLEEPLSRENLVELRKLQRLDFTGYPVPYQAKKMIQMRDFGKRWVFGSDMYTDEQLDRKALDDFAEAQSSVQNDIPQLERVERVLTTARRIASDILGPYTLEEHYSSCQFGSRAAFAVPRREGSLNKRILTLSCTRSQFSWFRDYLKTDKLLSSILRRNKHRSRLVITDALEVTTVPKSWKARRTITPDTVIGNFISSGLGLMIEKRLRLAGLDIRKLQEQHKRIAKSASLRGHLVTLDLSRASDMISASHLRRVLPPDWMSALEIDAVYKLHLCAIGQVQTTAPITARTFMTMGKGHTFPLQTLMFYVLVKAIQHLHGSKGLVSVYGDDIIYPVVLHRYVTRIFADLGYVINTDKSFSTGWFRESCGGDYLHGLNVRPYSPETETSSSKASNSGSKRSEAVAFLNKIANGLAERWEVWEIPRTLRFILIELQSLVGRINIVHPETAEICGIRPRYGLESWPLILEPYLLVKPMTVVPPNASGGWVGAVEFYGSCCTTGHPELIHRDDEAIFLWDWLRERASSDSVVTPPFLWRPPEAGDTVEVGIYRDSRERLIRIQKYLALGTDGTLIPKGSNGRVALLAPYEFYATPSKEIGTPTLRKFTRVNS